MAGPRRSGRHPLLLWALVALLLAGGVPPAAAGAQDDELARVRREVAGLRGRSFATDVEPVYLDRRQLRRLLIEILRA